MVTPVSGFQGFFCLWDFLLSITQQNDNVPFPCTFEMYDS